MGVGAFINSDPFLDLDHAIRTGDRAPAMSGLLLYGEDRSQLHEREEVGCLLLITSGDPQDTA